MKKVFSSRSAVCHKFNEQSQSEGRAGNIFFEGNRIYSYGHHYLLAEFISPEIILINDRGYSSSTSKHIWLLRDATSDKDQIFATNIEINLVLNELESLYKKLMKARKPRSYYYNITRLTTLFNRNLNRLGGFYVSNNLNSLFTLIASDNLSEDHQEKLNRINDIDKLADTYKASETYKNKVERAKQVDEARAEREKEKRARQEALRKLNLQERIEKFYSHEISRPGYGLAHDLLRVSKCGQYVETSQEVKIPIKEAQRFYKLFKSGAELVGERISQYTTKSNENYLQIGCHKIEHKEANRIGELILNF